SWSGVAGGPASDRGQASYTTRQSRARGAPSIWMLVGFPAGKVLVPVAARHVLAVAAVAGRLDPRWRACGALLLAAVAVAALVVGTGRQVGVCDAVLGALVVTHPHHFLVELGARDGDHAAPGAEGAAHRGNALGAVAVLHQLVGEAAHQPPACARDLAGVERELLFLGHLERDRVELLEPGGAAERTPARAAAVQALGLVAYPDLAQLDARVEFRRQVLDQVAEVHALLR